MNRTTLLSAVVGLLVGFGSMYFGLIPHFVPSMAVVTPLGVQTDRTEVVTELAVDSSTSIPDPNLPPMAEPTRLVIDKLQIDTTIEHVGLDETQRMDVPKRDENVAWYEYGPIPGEMGSSVLAGHYDSRTGGPAVFYDLDQLKAGDEITIYDQQGQSRTFVVSHSAYYKDAAFPIDEVFSWASDRRLNLITCAGAFDQVANNYQDRLVVYSTLKE